jgi:hypothetical protein
MALHLHLLLNECCVQVGFPGRQAEAEAELGILYRRVEQGWGGVRSQTEVRGEESEGEKTDTQLHDLVAQSPQLL